MTKFFILLGVSGAGKTTVLRESNILENPDITHVQSYTTRPLREGEVNGKKYFHISEDEFKTAIDNDEFLEYARVHDMYWYGTKKQSITKVLRLGRNPIKEMDMRGLIKVQEEADISFPIVTIFLDVPDEVMLERINGRGEMSEKELQERLASATFEREQAATRCDYTISGDQALEKVTKTFIDAINNELI